LLISWHQARKQLGNNIRQRRTQLSLSQEQLAEKANLHRTYIGAVERGERNISLDNILAIAQALGISGSELLEGID
jgi:transcriptional regulator with XRE-family HTH domain